MMIGPRPLPREVSPGVFWLGECLEQRELKKMYHSYNAAFLVIGETASMLVETGHPKDFPAIDRQVKEVMARGAPPLKYLFLTHQETPHSGGLGRVLDRYPDLTIHGDMSDYHLAFPEHADRMHWMKMGDSLDLGGGVKFIAVESIVRDLRTTLWGFLTKGRVLFPGDGFAYSHYHEDGHCGLTAEEAVSLDLKDTSAVFAERALFWTKFVDMNIYCEHLDRLFAELDVKTVCPAHGLVITDVAVTVPKVKEGLVYGSNAPSTRGEVVPEAVREVMEVS